MRKNKLFLLFKTKSNKDNKFVNVVRNIDYERKKVHFYRENKRELVLRDRVCTRLYFDSILYTPMSYIRFFNKKRIGIKGKSGITLASLEGMLFYNGEGKDGELDMIRYKFVGSYRDLKSEPNFRDRDIVLYGEVVRDDDFQLRSLVFQLQGASSLLPELSKKAEEEKIKKSLLGFFIYKLSKIYSFCVEKGAPLYNERK